MMTIQDVSRRSGLSEPTLRYYEQVGPVDRDEAAAEAEARQQVIAAAGRLGVR